MLSGIACLVSRDNGDSWQDHALSNRKFSGIYALGGCRRTTPGGDIIGSFAAALSGPDKTTQWKVYFFRIPGA